MPAVAETFSLPVVTIEDPAPVRPASARWPLATVCGLVLLAGLVLRWWMLQSRYGAMNSDEAMTGLMGYDVLHGHPTLTYGASTYGGVVEGLLAAPVVAVFGASRVALKAMNSSLWLVVWAGLAWSVRPLLGRTRAVLVGAVTWVASGPMVLLSTMPYLGYATGLLFAVVSLGGLLRSIEGDRQNRFAVLAGIFAGLALWSHPLFLVLLLPAFATGFFLRFRQNLPRWLVRIVSGTVVGASPLILWNVLHNGAGLSSPPQLKVTTYGERLQLMMAQLIPRGLGLRIFDGGWLYPRRLGMIAVIGFLALAVIGSLRLMRVHRSGLVMTASAVCAVPLLAAFPNTWFVEDGRYYEIIMVPLLVGLMAVTLPSATRRHRLSSGRWATLGLGAAVLFWGALSCGAWFRHEIPRTLINPDTQLVPVIDKLDAVGIHGIAGEYWAVYRVSFQSGRRIQAEVQAGPDRFPRMTDFVESLPREQRAYIYYDWSDHPELVPGNGATYDRTVIAGFALYLPKAQTT